MARKASPAKVQAMSEINHEAFQEDTGAMSALGAIAQGMQEERDLVNQLLGQAQMADAFAKFSVTVTTSKLAYVKENKLYRSLKGMKSGHGDQFLGGTWDEFCGLLGRSREQVDRDIANLRSFGEEALESMSRMGIGYREMRQYRKLPEDQKTALIEAAKSGDKDSFVDLAEELIAKHVKEKDTLTKKLDEVSANYDAQSRVLANTSERLQSAHVELEKARRVVANRTPDELAGELRQEVMTQATSVEASIACNLRPAILALAEHAIATGTDHRGVIAGVLAQVERVVSNIRNECGVQGEPDSDPTPDWLRADAESRIAEALDTEQ
ncbi:hypothetical protein [Pseudomonas putida]|uniref:hypothetical protein n=1 Tax=Pseudomonas putida TaxID=303 RepID=UPI000D4336AA|nr:hypothetical protein [Pseudomonas putida]POF97675.1 hypothetical protein BGP81_13500 [Pseudomonas putida]